MTTKEVLEILAIVVACTGLTTWLIGVRDRIRSGTDRERRELGISGLVTKEHCTDMHSSLASTMQLLREDIGCLRMEVLDLNKRVQNGDIANKLAQQVIQHIRDHEKKL